MKAGVLTSLNTVIYLAVVSIMWCLLSKQKMWFMSEFKDRLKLGVVEMVVFSAKSASPWIATLLPNCVITAGV